MNSHDAVAVSQIASVVDSSPSDAVTMYPLIGEPRLFGTDQDTVAEPPAAPTDTDDTASGKPAGTTATERTDAEEEPEAFEAFTLNRYEVPFTRPVTVHEVSIVVEQLNPPGNEVTTYPAIAAPPLLEGAVHDTTDEPFSPFVADTPIGAPATVDGITLFDASEAAPVPATFAAVTVNV